VFLVQYFMSVLCKILYFAESLVQQGVAGLASTERQVERGARLVVAVQRLARVVLQMPRGNLEAVQPRSLALHIVQKLLDKYK
jgi:hypothetical protein